MSPPRGASPNGYIAVFGRDLEVIGREHVKTDPLTGEDVLRQKTDGRCIFLDGTVGKSCSCRIYENRPQVCRTYERDEVICNSLRQMWGPMGPRSLVPRPEGWTP